MEQLRNIFSNSEIITEGTTCFILKTSDNKYYKIYKSSLKNIDNRDVDDAEIRYKLDYLVSKKNDIKNTAMPQSVVSFNGKVLGIELKYIKNSVSLKDFLLNNDNIDYVSIREKIMEVLNELLDNGIVPTDPHFDNFLVYYDESGEMKLNMVDVDDQYVSVYPDNKKSIWYESEVAACYRVVHLAFEEIKKEKNKLKK